MEELLRIDITDWTKETEETRVFFEKFGKRLPAEVREQHADLARRLGQVTAAQK